LPADVSPDQIQRISEQAYIMACQSVLPAGMLGMMLAAMFSATASTVSGQLNVFAGVLTNDIYRPLAGPAVTERRLVWVGRIATLGLGGVVLAIALSVPRFGGAEKIVIAVNSLLVVPLTGPLLWGLLNPRIGSAAVWTTAAVCFPLALVVKVGFAPDGILSQIPSFSTIALWIHANERTLDIALGVLLPVALLATIQLASRHVALGWRRLAALAPLAEEPAYESRRLPLLVVGWSLAALGLTMTALAISEDEDRKFLTVFAVALLAIAAGILLWSRRRLVAGRHPLNSNHLNTNHAEM
jgi:hypothetical protein